MENDELKPKKLYRSATDRLILGVCGGIADYYNIDATWVRLVFVFLAVAGGSGFLIYLILALLMPRDPSTRTASANKAEEKAEKILTVKDRLLIDKRRNAVGIVVIVLGALAFFKNSLPVYWIDWDVLWPIIIILIGLSIVTHHGRNK